MKAFKKKFDKRGKENVAEKRYDVTQTRKLISAYGGVGSIIETRNGALIISSFDEWEFFKTGEFKDEKYEISDDRLLNYLKKNKFEKLSRFVHVPPNGFNQYKGVKIKNATIKSTYFPEWMFCPNCKRFDQLKNWIENWRNHPKIIDEKKQNINPPKCFKCYVKAVEDKKGKKYHDLEQVRFIMTSPSGSIADVCWERWVSSSPKASQSGENNESSSTLNSKDAIRDDIYYQYTVSDKFNNLTGINITAKNKKTDKVEEHRNLKGLFGLRVAESEIFENGDPNIEMKVTLRSSNSVYYPNILNSLQLPNQETSGDTEEAYRLTEFQFVTSQTDYDSDDKYLTIKRISSDFYSISGLKNIYRLDSLKMTSVQVSFTRQEPIDKDYYLKEITQRNNQGQIIKKRYTSKKGLDTEYLPAVENLGEGIFFEFDNEAIQEWQNNDELRNRAKAIQDNYDKTKLSEHEQRTITPKYLLIHTFSHIIIKELEFLSGYPATSLRERLYISDDMQGVLIYTIAGAEGSYGGLVSLCDDTKIGGVIRSALERAKDCASDPICENTDLSGQGVGGTNLAACYSCALLPETSCEEFNRFLDRQALNSFFEGK